MTAVILVIGRQPLWNFVFSASSTSDDAQDVIDTLMRCSFLEFECTVELTNDYPTPG